MAEEVVEDKKDPKKTGNSKPKKAKQPDVLILFKVKQDANWAVYPRLFNTEETALTKLEQSYPFEDHCFQTVTFP